MPKYWNCFVSVGDKRDAAAILTEHRITGGDRQTAGGEQQTQEELLTVTATYTCVSNIYKLSSCHTCVSLNGGRCTSNARTA